MENGRLYFRLVALCALLCLSGCNSIRNATQTKEVRETAYYRDSVLVSSQLLSDTVRTECRDTIAATAMQTGAIIVHRDSTGKPERITWTVTQNVQKVTQRAERKEKWFYGLNATRYSESAGAVDSVSTKAEEVTQTVDTRISLENIIGPSLLSLVVLYLIYVAIVDHLWPWIKKKRSR